MQIFGKEAISELQVIECANDGKNSQKDLCDSLGIIEYPAWEIDGKIETGLKELDELKKLSNFKEDSQSNNLVIQTEFSDSKNQEGDDKIQDIQCRSGSYIIINEIKTCL